MGENRQKTLRRVQQRTQHVGLMDEFGRGTRGVTVRICVRSGIWLMAAGLRGWSCWFRGSIQQFADARASAQGY